VVYRATLNEKTIVAVKTPNTNLNADNFKALLLELKLVMTIGYHPNIVEFIGAVTTEIKHCKIYINVIYNVFWTTDVFTVKAWIVVEYCTNGDLEKYLKRLQTSESPVYDNQYSSKYIIILFAHNTPT